MGLKDAMRTLLAYGLLLAGCYLIFVGGFICGRATTVGDIIVR